MIYLLCLLVVIHLVLTVLDRSRAAAELRAIRLLLTEQDRQLRYDATDGPLSQRVAQRSDVSVLTPPASVDGPPVSGDYLKLPELGPETETDPETQVFSRLVGRS